MVLQITEETVTRIRLLSAYEDRDAAFKWMDKNGLRVTRSGPAPVRGTNSVDTSKVLLVGEKVTTKKRRRVKV